VNALIVTGAASVTVAPNAEALGHRDAHITAAKSIVTVATPADLQGLKITVNALKTVMRDAERNRVEVKSEPLRITQEIDRVAKEFSAPLQAEIARLEALANGYAREQARIQAEAEAKARAEREAEQRRIDEQLAAERKAIREKQEVDERERLAKQATAAPAPSFAAARAALAAQQAEQAAEAKAAQEREAVAQRAVVAAPAVAVKTEWRWKVTDALAFANAHPTLVTITPNTRDVNALVASGAREIAGLHIFEEVRAKL
jgi:chemotaxis protein histidine kinase CheA